jgi:hypothetical protein
MNTERLHAIAIALRHEMEKSNTPTRMQELINSLQNFISQQNPSFQQALAQNIKAMYTSITDTATDRFSPAWRQILRDIGGEDLFGKQLKLKIETVFSRNQITPVVALQELQQIHNRLKGFKDALEEATSSLRHFQIGNEKLAPGECEIGVLIPRDEVHNQLPDFAEEIKEIGFILNTFSEVATGKKDDLLIRTISASDFLVFLQASPPYAACVAMSIERLVALYKQLLEIRKLRLELKKQGVPDNQTTGVEDFANQLMEKGIDKIAEEVINEYHKKDDKGRKSELASAVKLSLNKIANRIDHGYNIEVRCELVYDKKDPAIEDKALMGALEKIQSATANMQFIKLEGQPLLSLPEGKEKSKKKA